jgi:hypothetical protein
MYLGNEDAVVIDPAGARLSALLEGMKANRMAACGVCSRDPEFGALQLHSRMSRDAAGVKALGGCRLPPGALEIA